MWELEDMEQKHTTTRKGKRREGTETITFPLPQDLKRKIGRIAFREGHTTSSWLRAHLIKYVRRNSRRSELAA